MFVNENGKKFLNLPEQVLQNQTDIATNKTNIASLQSSKQDTATAVNDDNLKEKVEALASVDLADVSVTSLTNTGNTTNTGTLDQEGKATFGSDVEVDGTITLNSPESVTFKTGSLDFNEITDFLDEYYANEGIAKFANQTFWRYESELFTASTSKYTDISRFLQNSQMVDPFSNTLTDSIEFPTFTNPINHMEMCIAGVKNKAVILRSLTHADTQDAYIFAGYDGERIEVKDGASVKMPPYNIYMFYKDANLQYIGAIDMSNCTEDITGIFSGCTSLKEIHCTHWKLSFAISVSTQFEESDLVEIIGNLDTVTTAQTLTMGSTNLAKLTQDEILVATGKGWTLA